MITTPQIASQAMPRPTAKAFRVQSSIALSWGHYGPSDEGISSVSGSDRQVAQGAEVRDPRAARGPQRAKRQEPQQTRAEAESLVRLLSAFPVAVGSLCGRGPRAECSDQVLIRQSASDNPAHHFTESVGIAHVLPVIEPKDLLVQIPEQVERFDADIRPGKSALEQGPEVFQTVRVDVAIDVLLGVVDDQVRVVDAVQAGVGLQGVCMERRALLDVLPDVSLQFMASRGLEHVDAHAAAAVGFRVSFKQAHHGDLAVRPTLLAVENR